jgi:phospholipase/carboxylesterase
LDKQLSLIHLVRKPTMKEDRPPLLLLLHGIGSNERDLFDLAPYLDQRFLILSLRAPNTIGRDSYAWFQIDYSPQGSQLNAEQAEDSRQKLITFIGEAVTAYGADPERVYLMGFSQGAIMSASIALTRPDLIAGAVLMSGRILPQIQTLIAPVEQLQGLPILVVHGTLDQVLAIENGRNSRDLLSALPVNLTYHEYAMGHTVSEESLADVTKWLSEQLDKSL